MAIKLPRRNALVNKFFINETGLDLSQLDDVFERDAKLAQKLV
jgi:hypothetical protein